MVLDSNILIGYLNGDRTLIRQVDAWRQQGQFLIISTVTLTEVLSLATLSVIKLRQYEQYLRTFQIVSPDAAIAEEAARLRRKYPISITDALIGATALLWQVPLVTRDADFERIRELELIWP